MFYEYKTFLKQSCLISKAENTKVQSNIYLILIKTDLKILVKSFAFLKYFLLILFCTVKH